LTALIPRYTKRNFCLLNVTLVLSKCV